MPEMGSSFILCAVPFVSAGAHPRRRVRTASALLKRGGETAQKLPVRLLKARVRYRAAGDQAGQLGEGQREPGEPDHGEQNVPGIELVRQMAQSLAAPDALQRRLGGLAPFLLINQPLLDKLQSLPFQQPDPIHVLPEIVKPKGPPSSRSAG